MHRGGPPAAPSVLRGHSGLAQASVTGVVYVIKSGLRDPINRMRKMAAEEPKPIDVKPIDVEAADAAYKPFPSFAEWSGVLDRPEVWSAALTRLADARTNAREGDLDKAFQFVMRAAAVDTGAIEDLYEVDRGFTYTVAAEVGAWEAAMEERGAQVRPLFEAQLSAYELVLDAATEGTPLIEAWLRRLHEEITSAQDTYRVLTQFGWEDRPLVRGRYKDQPNHVQVSDSAVHSYAPVAETAPEMQRLFAELTSDDFQAASAVVQAAYAHYALVAIHPFSDGNGRVARALASVFLYRDASVPLLVFADRKAPYLAALRASDQGEHQPFTSLVMNAAITAVNLVIDSLRAAATRPATESVDELRNLLIAQADLTHQQMDDAAASLLAGVQQALNDRLQELLVAFPAGLMAGLAWQGHPPETIPGFRLTTANPHNTVLVTLQSAAPAEAGVSAFFSVQVSTGRDVTESFVVARNETDERHVFALDEVYPDLSLAAHARLRSFAERVWNELSAEIVPIARNSLAQKGLAVSPE